MPLPKDKKLAERTAPEVSHGAASNSATPPKAAGAEGTRGGLYMSNHPSTHLPLAANGYFLVAGARGGRSYSLCVCHLPLASATVTKRETYFVDTSTGVLRVTVSRAA